MAHAFEVTVDHLSALGPEQLVELLNHLLHAEARRNGIARAGVHVQAKITVPDEGEDGRIQWEEGPDRTDYLPTRICLFQCKATDIPPSKCRKEVRASDGSLKRAVRNVLSSGGTYIMFCNRVYTGRQISQRIEAISQVVAEANGGSNRPTNVDFYDGNKVRDWVNSHPAVALWVLEKAGRPLAGFRTWLNWSGDKQMASYRFINSEEAGALMANLRGHLAQPRKTARLVGLSGRGKTRLALEAFRPPDDSEDPISRATNFSLVYVNAVHFEERIIEALSVLRDEGVDALVIVDDCDALLHRRLAEIVCHTNSRISLLTLDYDTTDNAGEDHFFNLGPAPDSVIEGIIKQAYPKLSPHDSSKVATFAKGFPQIATLLARAYLGGAPDAGSLTDDSLLKRLLWGRSQEDPRAREAIRSCAMFEKLGFDGRVSEQTAFVTHTIAEIPDKEFRRYVNEFIERDLIQQRGDFIQVQPRPMALRLAAEKWKQLSVAEAIALFKQDLPDGLMESLCDQLAKLDFLPKAKEVVREVLGSSGPLGQADVLNTERGSRCFNSLVETDPEAAMAALERAFGSWSAKQLMAVGPGRRNLIRALEKLCFRPQTFPSAARLLLSLATAENEPWGNNATGQFIGLYQLVLSGTQATPEEKLVIVEEALASREQARMEIAVRALSRGLQAGHFSRSGGAEDQGSGPSLRDWYPKDYKQIGDYLSQCLSRLSRIACGHGNLADLSREMISEHFRGLIIFGLVDELSDVVDRISAVHATDWTNLIDAVVFWLNSNKAKEDLQYKAKVHAFLQKLMPTDLDGRLQFFVSKAPWGMCHDDPSLEIGANWAQSHIDRLVRELIQTPDEIFRRLPSLLRGEQRQAWRFGKQLASSYQSPRELVDRSIAVLVSVPRDEANPSLLGGILSGLENTNRPLVDETLDRIARMPELCHYLPYLTSSPTINESDLLRLIESLESGSLPPENLRYLAHGSVLKHLDPSSVLPLIEALAARGGGSAWVALEIAAMYSYDNKARFEALEPQIERIILTTGLMKVKTQGDLDLYHFEETAIRLLTGKHPRPAIAKHLTQEILDLCGSESLLTPVNDTAKKLFSLLLEHYSGLVWPMISSAIENVALESRFRIENLLGGRFLEDKEKPGPVFGLPYGLLLSWCRNKPAVGPRFLARYAPLLQLTPDGKKTWSELVQALLAEFGQNIQVLSALHHNIWTFITWGSAAPYYEQYVDPLKSLLNHRHSAVRDWARAVLAAINQDVERARRRAEEWEWGIF